jgi:Tol biopolymer transport system component
VESDGGTVTGLNSPVTNNFGPPPAGTVYVLPNQYRDDVSFFSYGPAQQPEPSVVTISPPPGSYDGSIQLSFATQNATDEVQYRTSPAGAWQLYAVPFPLTNDATIQFYGQTSGGARGRTQSASYALGNIIVPAEPLVTLPGSATNAPVVDPTIPQISAGGTVFYGRRGSNSVPSIWAINLDGGGETFITTGREPRVSRDGRWLAFWRENDPLTNQFSLWLRDLPAAQESRWTTRSNRFVGYDWQRDNTNLIFAADGLFWRIGLSTPSVVFPLASDVRQGAPAVNPVDGRIALQVIYPGSIGLYLAPSNLTARQNLGLNILSPRWPGWSPDGTRIVVADDPNISPVLDAGHNLWVVTFGGQTNIYQITALNDNTNGFPNGAVWTPGGNKLVTAGSIGGVNGLWVLPVSTDGSECHCQPQLLPTSPGDPIDFAGSVLTTANSSSMSYANLGLFIRLDPSLVVVYWSTNYDGFTLESAAELPAGFSWSSVTGPYFRAGPYFEYREARTELAARKYFRLHYPGVLVLTPPEPAMALHLEPDAAVLNWPLNYVGYSIEATTNLSPPTVWTPLAGGAVNTNGVFEYRRVLPGPAQEFYRLRGPQ